MRKTYLICFLCYYFSYCITDASRLKRQQSNQQLVPSNRHDPFSASNAVPSNDFSNFPPLVGYQSMNLYNQPDQTFLGGSFYTSTDNEKIPIWGLKGGMNVMQSPMQVGLAGFQSPYNNILGMSNQQVANVLAANIAPNSGNPPGFASNSPHNPVQQMQRQQLIQLLSRKQPIPG